MKRICLICLLLLCACAVSACASDLQIQAQIGYDGMLFSARVNPLCVQITNDGDAFSGVLCIDVNKRYDQYDRMEMPVHIGAGETVSLKLPIIPVMTQEYFDVRVVSGEETLAEERVYHERMTPSEAMVIGVIAGDEQTAQAFSVTQINDVLQRGETISAIRFDAFDMTADELSAFDVLVFDGGEADETQMQLAQNWAHDGGIILISADDERAIEWVQRETGLVVNRCLPGQGNNAAKALLAYTDVSKDAEPVQALYSFAGDMVKHAVYDEGSCILAAVPMGKGLVVVCGFSLRQPQILNLLEHQALWQRLLLKMEPSRYRKVFEERTIRNYHSNYGYVSSLRIASDKSIAPVLVMLTVYALLAGIGLYWLLRKRERSRELWLFVPVSALAAWICTAVCASWMGLNQSAASSVRVTRFDADGCVYSEELVRLSSSEDKRIVVASQDGYPVERMGYHYFNGYADPDTEMELRDVMVLGTTPSIELPAAAPWTLRELVVRRTDIPEGQLLADVRMEEDGLHVNVSNMTEYSLQNVMLVTGMGYCRLEDLPSGGTLETTLVRQNETAYTPDGEPKIVEGVLTPYTVGIHSVISACVYPERQDDSDFSSGTLSEQERMHRSREESRLQTGNVGSEGFACLLIADCPQLSPSVLMIDGEPAAQRASAGVVVLEMELDSRSESGYFYYPEGAFSAFGAYADEDGIPRLKSPIQERYAFGEGKDVMYGFRLDGISPESIRRIHVINEYGGRRDTPSVKVYDAQNEKWVSIDSGEYAMISGGLLSRIVSDKGELFIRYSSEDSEEISIYAPQIIVEGSEGV